MRGRMETEKQAARWTRGRNGRSATLPTIPAIRFVLVVRSETSKLPRTLT